MEIYNNSDGELIRSIQKGDNVAFSNLYSLYSRGIYRKLLHMVKIPQEAEELLQETFVRLWEKRSYLDPGVPIMPYLLRIAGNLVYDLYRRTSRDRQLQDAILQASYELYHHTEEDMLYKESKALIDQAIELLPKQQRKVFVMGKLEGKSYKEISEILQIGEATVSTHIVRATKSVKTYLFNAHEGPTLLIAYLLMLN